MMLDLCELCCYAEHLNLPHCFNQCKMKNINHGIANILAIGRGIVAQKLCTYKHTYIQCVYICIYRDATGEGCFKVLD